MAGRRTGGVARCRDPSAARSHRHAAFSLLFFREIFEFRLVLLDFGATRAYGVPVVDAYRRLIAAAVAGNRAAMSAAAQAIGYVKAGIAQRQRDTVLDIFACACLPLVRLRDAGSRSTGRARAQRPMQ